MITLPRLLYVGNVPVDAGMGGSALIYRLLYEYPPDQLMIMQASEGHGYGFERLRGVQYRIIEPMRFLPSRLHNLRAVVSIVRAYMNTRSIAAQIESFRPSAIVTVTHGCEWIAAHGIARRLGLPLHLILHDDWEPTLRVPAFLRSWLNRYFARAYRDAVSRLCVSPYMAAYYEELYGAPGTVLYPGRAKDVVAPNEPPKPRGSDVFTVGYAGSVYGAYAPALRALATSLEAIEGRLRIFSTLSPTSAKALGLTMPNIEIEPVMPPAALILNLRSRADALFLVVTEVGLGSRIYFPSKLVDYTATGLPIIISAPEDSAPAYWVREHPKAGLLVRADDNDGLEKAIVNLASDPVYRRSLGAQAQKIGNEQFAYERARDTFFASVRSLH